MPTKTADKVEDYSVGEDPKFAHYSKQLQAIAEQPLRSMAETRDPQSHFVDTLLVHKPHRPETIAQFNVEDYYNAFKTEAERQLMAALRSRAANSADHKQPQRNKQLPQIVPIYEMSDRYREWYDRYGNFAGPALKVLMAYERNSRRLAMLAKIYLYTTWDFAYLTSTQQNMNKQIGTDGNYLDIALNEVIETAMDKYLRFCPHGSLEQLLGDCVLLQKRGVQCSYIPALLAIYYHSGGQKLSNNSAESIGHHFAAYRIQGDLNVLFDKVSEIAADLGQAPEP